MYSSKFNILDFNRNRAYSTLKNNVDIFRSLLLVVPAEWFSGNVVALLIKCSRVRVLDLLLDFSLVENCSTVHVLSCVVFIGGPCILLTKDQRRLSNCVRVYLWLLRRCSLSYCDKKYKWKLKEKKKENDFN